MMNLAALLISTWVLFLAILLVTQILSAIFIPRLELAKGVGGSPHKFRVLSAIWGLGVIWKSREITWKSVWIVVLGCQTVMSALFLGPIFLQDWAEKEKLLVPLVFLFQQILIVAKVHRRDGEKHPTVRWITYSAFVGALGLTIVLFGIQAHQVSEGAWILGYIVKWFLMAFLYAALAPFLTFDATKEVPILVARQSQFVWATGMAMIFWPSTLPIASLALVEQFLKIVVLVFLHDIGKSMFSKIKIRFFEDLAMNLIFPLMFIVSAIVVLGF